jgi:hypothetical protein
MDEASPVNIKALVDKAKQIIDDEHKRIEELGKLLAEPKDGLQTKERRRRKRGFCCASLGATVTSSQLTGMIGTEQ